MLFKDAVFRAFEDMFIYLGIDIIYQPRGAAPFTITGVLKNPETSYVLGESDVVRQAISIAVRSCDVEPRVGDLIVLDEKTYKIYREPLLDGYDYIWKIEATLV